VSTKMSGEGSGMVYGRGDSGQWTVDSGMELGAYQRGVAHRTDETLDLARKAEGRGGISPSGEWSQSRSERCSHHCAGVDGG
jgi:hypothetical protein